METVSPRVIDVITRLESQEYCPSAHVRPSLLGVSMCFSEIDQRDITIEREEPLSAKKIPRKLIAFNFLSPKLVDQVAFWSGKPTFSNPLELSLMA